MAGDEGRPVAGVDPPARARAAPGRSLSARGGDLVERWQRSRSGRANARFRARSGGVLAGGIAYATLFSVFAALTISWTTFLAVLGDDDELRTRVLVAIDTTYPYLLDTGDGRGLLDPAVLELPSTRTLATVVAVVVLLLSAIAAMTALRRAVRAMFVADLRGNVMIGKARDLGGFVGMVLAVLLSAVLTTGVGTVASWLLDALGWDGLTTLVLRGLGILVAFVVDVAFFVLVVTVLADEHPPRRDLVSGAVIAASGLAVLRGLGTTVVAGSLGANPVVTSVAVLVTVLVWINLIARIVLLAAAWTADPPFADRSADRASARA